MSRDRRPVQSAILSLYKNFSIGGSRRFSFALNAFNFLNHPLPEFNAINNSDVQLKFSDGPGI